MTLHVFLMKVLDDRLVIFTNLIPNITGLKTSNFNILHAHFYRGSKDFSVSIGHTQNGPWTKILDGSFPDLRNETEEGYAVIVPLTVIRRRVPQVGRFIKYQCDTWWGDGCALHYLGFSNQGPNSIDKVRT